jgi:hypothetical protein
VRPRVALLAVYAAAVIAPGAGANGDPASDVLPFSTVFLSAQRPESSPSGRDLLFLTRAAAKRRFPVRVAVIYQPTDLGLIQSLWRKPQPYANFLSKELVTFGRYNGTLLVAMPNGFGIAGPGSTPAVKRALAELPQPGAGSLDDLGGAAAVAVRRLAAADGRTLPSPPRSSKGTPAWLIALAALGGAALIAAAVFLALRRWLTHPA